MDEELISKYTSILIFYQIVHPKVIFPEVTTYIPIIAVREPTVFL